MSQIFSPRSLESGCGETELVIVRLPMSWGGVGAEKTSVHGSGATEQEDSSQRQSGSPRDGNAEAGNRELLP